MTANVKRKLAAILAADAAGYSRMMGADEEGTLRVLARQRAVIDGIIALHEGRIVGTAGDSVLAEFESAVEAVRCAVEIQEALKTRNDALPEDERMLFRIGVNLGDVMISGDDLHGDGVNVAARLESIADPGGVCVSSSVYDQIAGKLNLGFVDIGNRELKNIARPIHVYKLAGTAPAKPIALAAPKAASFKPAWAIGVTAVAVIAALVAWQAGWFATPPKVEPAKPTVEAELAKARATADEANRRAETESAAAAEAKRQLEAQRASEMKARSEAELAKAHAEADAIRRKADAELAAARQKQEQPPKATESAPKPAGTVALATPTAAASRYDGNWTATRSCEPFEEFPSQVRSWQFTATGGNLIVSHGQPGQPGYMTVRGRPSDDGNLVLAGKIVSGAARYRGQEGPAYFEGQFDGERFVLKGRIGRRACTLVLARAGG